MKKYKIALDDGHDLNTPGKRTPPLPNGSIILENEFNYAVKLKLMKAIARHGLEYVDCAPGQSYYSLDQRVRTANAAKADIFISIHYNAFRGNWDETKGGIETYYYKGSIRGKHLADAIHNQLVRGTPQINRGVKEGNFQVIRETVMPAILIEAGFMDVRAEALLMRDESYQLECAEEIMAGICDYFKMPYIPPVSGLKDIEGHYAQKEILEIVKMGIMRGYGNDTFRPNQQPTRAELAIVALNIIKYMKGEL